MKKTSLFKWVLYSLVPALTLITIALIVNSCRKEGKLTTQELNAAKAAEQFPVNTAMSWFNSNKASLATKVKINSDASFLKTWQILHRYGIVPARLLTLTITW